jgi:hypothetical protein
MKNIHYIIYFLAGVLLWGCPEPTKIERGRNSKPEMVLQIAALDMSGLNKRIEKKNIEDLAKILRREKVDILAVQGVSRYPGVSTRIDFIEAISERMEWRNSFGEISDISGKQTGNSVLSFYPIISRYNRTFDDIKSAQFEGALETVVDAGVLPILVVSARLPQEAGNEECVKRIIASAEDRKGALVLITGNLKLDGIGQYRDSYSEIKITSAGEVVPKIWHSIGGQADFIRSRIVKTDLGVVVIAELALFK